MSYLICEKDQAVPVEMQRKEIMMVKEESGNVVDVQMIDSGHCPHISAPEKVVDWVLSLVQRPR